MLYPMKFDPVYKHILWGGQNIRRVFGLDIPEGKVAESWELCCRNDGMSVLENGALSGQSLQKLIDTYREKLLGEKSVSRYGLNFPLLIKIIDANDRLSVQVHPDDAYAKKTGEANGKNEAWYIIDAKKGAKLIYGLKENLTKAEFEKAVARGEIGKTLREVPVRAGDCLYIPAGTVHAILDGILIAEIQQNSNTTYRIYDWDRVGADGKGRELHLDRALDVIRFGAVPEKPADSAPTEDSGKAGYALRHLVKSEFFFIDEVTVTCTYEGKTQGSFLVLMNLAGEGVISCDAGDFPLTAGETFLLPACLGNYSVKGNLRMLLSGI